MSETENEKTERNESVGPDTQIIRALDADNGTYEKSKSPSNDCRMSVWEEKMYTLNSIFNCSFNVILANTVLSFGQFFSVVILTLWRDCPSLIWGAFLFYCVLSPIFLCLINARLLISLSRGATGRMSLRE